MCDRIDLLKRIKELEKENSLMKEAIDHQDWVINNLQQALDKACEQLESFDMTFNDKGCCDVKNWWKWKAWCMSDGNA